MLRANPVKGGMSREVAMPTSRPGSKMRSMYIVIGRVIHGRGFGKHLGFPTANVRPKRGNVIPPDGVYAAWAQIDQGWFRAAVSVGKSPMFSGSTRTIEAHILNRMRSLYGRRITLVFVRRLRSMRRFSSIKKLTTAIARDIARTRRLLVAERRKT